MLSIQCVGLQYLICCYPLSFVPSSYPHHTRLDMISDNERETSLYTVYSHYHTMLLKNTIWLSKIIAYSWRKIYKTSEFFFPKKRVQIYSLTYSAFSLFNSCLATSHFVVFQTTARGVCSLPRVSLDNRVETKNYYSSSDAVHCWPKNRWYINEIWRVPAAV